MTPTFEQGIQVGENYLQYVTDSLFHPGAQDIVSKADIIAAVYDPDRIGANNRYELIDYPDIDTIVEQMTTANNDGNAGTSGGIMATVNWVQSTLNILYVIASIHGEHAVAAHHEACAPVINAVNSIENTSHRKTDRT